MNFFFFNLMEDWRQFWKRLTGSGRSSGETSRLYVGNLSYNAKEEDLKALFSGCGRVLDVHLIRDRFTRKPKGYAFVEVAKDDTSKALTLSGTDFLGRKLVVSEAKSKGPGSQGSGQPPQQGGGKGRRNRPEHRGGHERSGGHRSGGRRRSTKGPRAYRPGPQQVQPQGSPQGPKDGPAQLERLE